MRVKIPYTHAQTRKSARMRTTAATIILFAKILNEEEGMPLTQVRQWVDNLNRNYPGVIKDNDTWADEIDEWAIKYHLQLPHDCYMKIAGVYTLSGNVLRRLIYMCLYSLRPLGYGGIRLRRIISKIPLNRYEPLYTYEQLRQWADSKNIRI